MTGMTVVPKTGAAPVSETAEQQQELAEGDAYEIPIFAPGDDNLCEEGCYAIVDTGTSGKSSLYSVMTVQIIRCIDSGRVLTSKVRSDFRKLVMFQSFSWCAVLIDAASMGQKSGPRAELRIHFEELCRISHLPKSLVTFEVKARTKSAVMYSTNLTLFPCLPNKLESLHALDNHLINFF